MRYFMSFKLQETTDLLKGLSFTLTAIRKCIEFIGPWAFPGSLAPITLKWILVIPF